MKCRRNARHPYLVQKSFKTGRLNTTFPFHFQKCLTCAKETRALRTICYKFLRSGGETSLNCLKFPQIRFSSREYSAGLKTCENSRKRTRSHPKKTHSENESEKSSSKKAKIESITKVIFRVFVRPSI